MISFVVGIQMNHTLVDARRIETCDNFAAALLDPTFVVVTKHSA
jgi:Zn-dependent peptidase ImmA (M78 family)